MKKPKSLFFRLEEPTVETIFAEYEEGLFAFSINPNFSLQDLVNFTKHFFAPAVHAYLSRAKLEDNSLGQANRKRRQEAEQRKRTALVVAARLLSESKVLRLARKKSELALRVHKQLAKDGIKPPPQRTIRRWLDEMIPPKK
jgi:hypothetical protein